MENQVKKEETEKAPPLASLHFRRLYARTRKCEPVTVMDVEPYLLETIGSVEPSEKLAGEEVQRSLMRTWRKNLDEKQYIDEDSAYTILWKGNHPLEKNDYSNEVSARARRRREDDAPPAGKEQQAEKKLKSGASPRASIVRRDEASARITAPALAEIPDDQRDSCMNFTQRIPSNDLFDYQNYIAPYRIASRCRETRNNEKEDRRRAVEHEEWRRKKQSQLLRAIMNRRDEIAKKNRSKRNDAAKCARMCKQFFEHLSHRAEVEDAKAGRKRLAALRANDMEAYTKLVEETKNERLKYLLHETDKYIVSITEKVKQQRIHEEYDDALKAGQSATAALSAAAILDADGDHRMNTSAEESKYNNGTTTTTIKAETRTGNSTDEPHLAEEEKRRRATSEYYKITHQRLEEVKQPAMLTGGMLKEYQLAGVGWLVSLYNNRLNGILADEMGLGKTIQSIALLAHLMEEKHNHGPFLVVAPLSTLGNWANEFAKWTPNINCLSYKGPPAARKQVQREISEYLAWLKHQRAVDEHGPSISSFSGLGANDLLDDDDDIDLVDSEEDEDEEIDEDLDDDNAATMSRGGWSSSKQSTGRGPSAKKSRRSSGQTRRSSSQQQQQQQQHHAPGVGVSTTPSNKPNFNVLLTTYEYIMRDRAVLRKVEWQYIIVDEGHRMKNANSKFAQTLGQLYTAKRRLLLTGTPLQNSLPELWALLNFLLPSIFSSCDTFEGWFNRPFSQFGAAAQSNDPEATALGHEERMLVINRLHEVLRPFVLRRVKAAVLGQLPEKIEKVLRCPLTPWQRIVYEQIQRSRLSAAKPGTPRSTLLEQLDDGASQDEDDINIDEASSTGGGRGSGSGTKALPVNKAARGGLNNVLMQLRKCCNHPYLFRTDAYLINEDLIRSSGKFLLLDNILPKFKAGGHRVLMFSQMTAVMDLLEEFLTFRGYSYLRLDGSTHADERERCVARFNDPCSPNFVFLLSTRAGGLGLNLASADTVVIFDSDWNPMMDSQAQDRAHRIGQRNDVRVFRLIAAAPVEERILARATDKLNVNSLVVEAGKFNKESRAHERKQMLEELLREYCAPNDDASEIGARSTRDSDDGNGAEETARSKADALYETIATSNEEFEMYKVLDRQANGGLRPMTIYDVPDFVKHGCDSADHYEATLADDQQARTNSLEFDARNRSARKRRNDVPYYDSLSERDFLKLVQSGSLDKPPQSFKALGKPGSLHIRVRKAKRKRGRPPKNTT